MKKVLVVNTKYKIFGGEDSNIVQELLFLEKYYEVKFLEFDNSKRLNWSDLLGFLLLSNFHSNKQLKKALVDFEPDFVYVHNTWFIANLGLFKILKKFNVKTLIKIHNFRFLCTNTFSAKKHLNFFSHCPMCGFENRKYKIFNKYFRESILKSIFVNYYGIKYSKILKNYPFKLIVLNEFYKKTMIERGFLSENISVLYNPLNVESEIKYKADSNYVVYAGLLSTEKGLSELIKAWVMSKTDLNLFIIGSGKLSIEQLKNFGNSKIHFFGHLDNVEVINYIKNSRAVITATKMFEGQPRLLTEASMLGIPSIYPSYGGMDEYFPNDYIFSFKQFDENDLIEKIKLLGNKDLLVDESKRVLKNINKILNQKLINTKLEKILSIYE